MLKINKSKKGITEIISFVLIILLVVVFSISAYYFAKDTIQNKVNQLDYENMNSFLKKTYYKTEEIKNFDDQSFTIPLNFRTGGFSFEGNKASFQSFVEFTGSPYCTDSVCHDNVNGFDLISFELEDGYTFENNFDLVPGNYLVYFNNIKNESKIRVVFK